MSLQDVLRDEAVAAFHEFAATRLQRVQRSPDYTCKTARS